MERRFLLIISIAFLISLSLYSITAEKNYVITVGGTLSISPGGFYFIDYLPFYTIQTSISIPFSTVFYLTDIFALGFGFDAGFNAMGKWYSEDYGSKYSYWLILFDFVSDLKIINKFGRLSFPHKFLLEYGLLLTGRFCPFKDEDIYKTTYSEDKSYYTMSTVIPAFLSLPHFMVGPFLFLGYEISKKNFSYIIGSSFKFQVGKTQLRKKVLEGEINYSVEIMEFNIGIEMRWLFNYISRARLKSSYL